MYNDIYQSCIKVVLKLYVSKLYQSFVTVLSKLNIKVALREAYGMLPFRPEMNNTALPLQQNDISSLSQKGIFRSNTDDSIGTRMKSIAGYDSLGNKQKVIHQIIDSLKALLW